MTINELYEELRKDENLMEFNPPITDTEITKFQSKNGIAIPPALIELYELFNGGEIYIPGTLIFGVNVDDSAMPRTVKHENRSSKRNALSIPNNYLIFGKLNYGDILCINLNNPYDVILWDHELNEQSCSWAGLSDWLEDEFVSFREYEDSQT